LLILGLVACGPGQPLACDGQAYVDRVEVVEQGGNYFAAVQGNYPDACSSRGRVTQQVVGQTIKITLCTQAQGDACAQVLVPFTERIELDVAGLPAGQYTVDVNGTVTMLTLLQDQ
jgi:hypothetical protein